jgi:hypothetical protein
MVFIRVWFKIAYNVPQLVAAAINLTLKTPSTKLLLKIRRIFQRSASFAVATNRC